jgi:hypothetical protein
MCLANAVLHLLVSCPPFLGLFREMSLLMGEHEGRETGRAMMLPSPRPWDFPPSIDGDVSREDDPMEVDEPDRSVSPD